MKVSSTCFDVLLNKWLYLHARFLSGVEDLLYISLEREAWREKRGVDYCGMRVCTDTLCMKILFL